MRPEAKTRRGLDLQHKALATCKSKATWGSHGFAEHPKLALPGVWQNRGWKGFLPMASEMPEALQEPADEALLELCYTHFFNLKGILQNKEVTWGWGRLLVLAWGRAWDGLAGRAPQWAAPGFSPHLE